MTERDYKAPNKPTATELVDQLKTTLEDSKGGLILVSEGVDGLKAIADQVKESDDIKECRTLGMAMSSIARDIDANLWKALDQMDDRLWHSIEKHDEELNHLHPAAINSTA